MTTGALIAYIPVVHAGYMELFRKHAGKNLFVIGDEILEKLPEFDYLRRKDKLRALSPDEQICAIESWGIFSHVEVLDSRKARKLGRAGASIYMPDEDISRTVAEEYFSELHIEFESIFLRWNRDNTAEKRQVEEEFTCSRGELDRLFIQETVQEGARSFDWWRQVGGLLLPVSGKRYIGHNIHLPEEQTPYIVGDPRSLFKRGIHIELSTAIHVEMLLISEATRIGDPLQGASLYVTDFPCPPCARLVAFSGISHFYFMRGYSVLDGVDVLKAKDVKIIRVEPLNQ